MLEHCAETKCSGEQDGIRCREDENAHACKNNKRAISGAKNVLAGSKKKSPASNYYRVREPVNAPRAYRWRTDAESKCVEIG